MSDLSGQGISCCGIPRLDGTAIRILAFSVCGWLSLGTVVSGQFPGFRGPTESSPTLVSQLPFDPQLEATFQRGLQGLKSGQTAEGLEALQQLLDGGSDFFLPQTEGEPKRLRDEVERALRDSRENYQQLYGTQAEELWQRAHERQDPALWMEVARRFSLTDAGPLALERLAVWHHMRGEPMAAARWFERLATHPVVATRQGEFWLAAVACWREAGFNAQAERLVNEQITVLAPLAESRKWPAPVADQAANWLATVFPLSAIESGPDETLGWSVPFGGVTQSGWSSSAPVTEKPLWQRPLLDEHDQLPPEMVRMAQELAGSVDRSMRNNRDRVALPVGQPLVVGDTVITSGFGIIRAFDRQTGELKWPGVVVDDSFDHLFRASYAPDHPQNADGRRNELIELFAASRGWRDLTSCSLSTDGRYVYAVKGCQLPNTLPPQMLQFNPTRDPRLPQRDNQLFAYNLETGALVWSIIGEAPISGPESLLDEAPRRSPIFFYGAPLPVDGRLFCVGEERGQVQLFELNPDAVLEGEVIWSMGLFDPHQGEDILFENHRRMGGMMPAYVGGMLICPTGGGSLMAIDIETRSVVWNRSYRQTEPELARQARMPFPIQRPGMVSSRQTAEEILRDDRWFDCRLIVNDDRVLFTPPDADELVCLNVLTGNPAWEQRVTRNRRLYVGGIFNDAAIVVSATDVQLISLRTGATVWQEPVIIPTPSGRGVRTETRFLQPLSTGEVAVIDLPTGRLLCRIPCDVNGSLGNLVAQGGQLFYQSGTGITAFESLSAFESRLSAASNESHLALSAEWDLQQGNIDAGIAKLKQVMKSKPQPRVHQLLGWALLDGLQHDFERYSDSIAEIETYCTTPGQRDQFLDVLAAGLLASGREEEAIDVYLKLLAQHTGNYALEDRNGTWRVRYDRRTGGELKSLQAELKTQQHISQFLKQLPEDPARRLGLLEILGVSGLSAEELVAALASLELNEALTLQREGLALQLLSSSEPQRQALGHYLLALFALKQNDPVTAERELRNLAQFMPEQIVLNDKNGAQLATELRRQPDWDEGLAAAADWPSFTHRDERPPLTPQNQTQLPVLGNVDGALEGWSFFMDQLGASVRVYDADGVRRGDVATGLNSGRAIGSTFGRFVQMRGHVACVVCQDRMLVLDLLSNAGQPRLLCTRSLSGEASPNFLNQMALRSQPGLRGAFSRTISATGTWLGNVGPFQNATLCYSLGTTLIGIDPLTGQDLWRRQGIPEGSEVIGDHEFTVAVSFENRRFSVVRTLDGQLVREGVIPNIALAEWNGLDWGRLIPCLDADIQQSEFSVYDPVTDRTLWSIDVPQRQLLHSHVGGRHFAYLDAADTFHVLNTKDGTELWQVPLAAEEPAVMVTTRQREDGLLIITSRVKPSANEFEPGEAPPVAQGTLTLTMVDAWSGESQWTRTLEGAGEYVLPPLPSRWPIVAVFSRDAEIEQATPTFPRRVVPQSIRAVIYDRKTGEVVASQAGLESSTSLGWSGEKLPYHRIKLRLGTIDISLKCLDTPPGNATEELPSTPAVPPADPQPTVPEQSE